MCGFHHLCAGAFFLCCAAGLPIFSPLANLLALQELPFATWQAARLHRSCVVQIVLFFFDVSGVTKREHDRTQKCEPYNFSFSFSFFLSYFLSSFLRQALSAQHGTCKHRESAESRHRHLVDRCGRKRCLAASFSLEEAQGVGLHFRTRRFAVAEEVFEDPAVVQRELLETYTLDYRLNIEVHVKFVKGTEEEFQPNAGDPTVDPGETGAERTESVDTLNSNSSFGRLMRQVRQPQGGFSKLFSRHHWLENCPRQHGL